MNSAPDKSNIFVGREDLLKQFLTEWEAFTQRKHTYSGYFLYAIAGMGKTWALRTFYYLVGATGGQAIWLRILDRSDPPPLPQPLAHIPALIGLLPTPPNADTNPHVQRRLKLRDGLAEVGEQLGMGYLWDGLLPELDTYDLEFELPHNMRANHLVAVCLDGVDLLERNERNEKNRPERIGGVSLWENLQDHWLRPLLSTQRCFSVLTGQGIPTWKHWDMGSIIKAKRLEQLRRIDVDVLLRNYTLENNTTALYQLSQGHSASITYLIRRVLGEVTPLPDELNKPTIPINVSVAPSSVSDMSNSNYVALLSLAPARVINIPVIHLLTNLPQGRAIAKFLSNALSLNIIESRTRSTGRDKPDYNIEPEIRTWLLEKRRQTDTEGLVVQYKEIAEYYQKLIAKDPIRYSLSIIEWMHASLQYQFLQMQISSVIRAEWRKDFETLWQSIPEDAAVALDLQEDLFVRSLLKNLDYEELVVRFWGTVDLECDSEKVRTKLDEFIRDRMPNQLSDENWKLIERLAQLGSPVKLKDVQYILSELRSQNEINAVTAREKIRDLSDIYAIKKITDGYEVDEWLSMYLRRDKGLSH